LLWLKCAAKIIVKKVEKQGKRKGHLNGEFSDGQCAVFWACRARGKGEINSFLTI